MATVTGSTGNDLLDAADGVTAGNDVIDGLAGNDTIFGLGGDDVITGGPATGSTQLDFNWSAVPDPNGGGGAGIDNNDPLPTSTTQNTGGINVTATYADLVQGTNTPTRQTGRMTILLQFRRHQAPILADRGRLATSRLSPLVLLRSAGPVSTTPLRTLSSTSTTSTLAITTAPTTKLTASPSRPSTVAFRLP
ncbi:MAG: hypothetical protein HC783_04835 [Rhodobacteraceae bacterium]|nr:hypothetical protein [Paracoccaceae bacterium]